MGLKLRQSLILFAFCSIWGCQQSPLLTPLILPSAMAQPIASPVLQAHYVGQLFYQLDCLSGQGNCSREPYLKQWQSQGFNTGDLPMLALWQETKASLSQTQNKPHTVEQLAEPLVFQSSNLWDQLRVTALNTETLADFETEVTPLMSSAQRESLLRVLQHFSERFMARWWENEGKATSQHLLSAYTESFKTHDMPAFIQRMVQFYEHTGDPHALRFNLILQAPGAEDLSFAEQILNQGLIEVSPTQAPHSQLDVMMHELSHYFFKQLSPETQANIQGFFARQTDADAMGAYHLLDESLATALGNGHVNAQVLNPDFFKAMQNTPLHFFNDPFIDSNAKAIFAAGLITPTARLNSDSFLQAYYTTTRQAVDLSQLTPALRLSAVCISDASLQPFVSALQTQLKPWVQFQVGLSSAPRFLLRYPRLNGLLILGEDLSALEAFRELLGDSAYHNLKAAEDRGAFVYGIPQDKRQIYVVRVLSDTDPEALFQRLLRQQTFEGFLAESED